MTLIGIEKLRSDHETGNFDCDKPALNHFLKRFALSNQRANLSQTYVLCRHNQIIAYYSLTVGSVEHKNAPRRIVEGAAQYPVPVMILARLAVSQEEQGNGLGAALLKDSLKRTANAAHIAGIRAFLVHAQDASSKQFYEQFDFVASPTDPLHLFLLMKDILRLLA